MHIPFTRKLYLYLNQNRCSTSQSGDLTKTDRAIDGIFGFGQQGLSVISQLSSRGITPKVFSHCLKGEGNGGGILVLGEILDPRIVYSPLVPSQYVLLQYNEVSILAYTEYRDTIVSYLGCLVLHDIAVAFLIVYDSS